MTFERIPSQTSVKIQCSCFCSNGNDERPEMAIGFYTAAVPESLCCITVPLYDRVGSLTVACNAAAIQQHCHLAAIMAKHAKLHSANKLWSFATNRGPTFSEQAGTPVRWYCADVIGQTFQHP